MKVTLLNPEVLETMYKTHGEFACECYNTPKKYAVSVGKSCQEDGHWSGSRSIYINFEIEADRGTLEQILRSEIGVYVEGSNVYGEYDYADYIETRQNIPPDEIVKNMKSFRYCVFDGFTYETPKNIRNNPTALALYQNCMSNIDTTATAIRKLLVEDGIDEHKAIEDANFVLPRATMNKVALAMTPEALIRFMWKRLCTRAQDEIHAVAVEMKRVVREVNPEFADKNLMPHCQHLLWCPEGKRSCGAYPPKKKVIELIEKGKNMSNKD